MVNTEIISTIEELKEFEALAAEVAAEIENLRDTIKREMEARNTEEIAVGQYVARFTTVLSNRFDTTGFKREHGDLYKAFTKSVTSRRFSISG